MQASPQGSQWWWGVWYTTLNWGTNQWGLWSSHLKVPEERGILKGRAREGQDWTLWTGDVAEASGRPYMDDPEFIQLLSPPPIVVEPLWPAPAQQQSGVSPRLTASTSAPGHTQPHTQHGTTPKGFTLLQQGAPQE